MQRCSVEFGSHEIVLFPIGAKVLRVFAFATQLISNPLIIAKLNGGEHAIVYFTYCGSIFLTTVGTIVHRGVGFHGFDYAAISSQ